MYQTELEEKGEYRRTNNFNMSLQRKQNKKKITHH